MHQEDAPHFLNREWMIIGGVRSRNDEFRGGSLQVGTPIFHRSIRALWRAHVSVYATTTSSLPHRTAGSIAFSPCNTTIRVCLSTLRRRERTGPLRAANRSQHPS